VSFVPIVANIFPLPRCTVNSARGRCRARERLTGFGLSISDLCGCGRISVDAALRQASN